MIFFYTNPILIAAAVIPAVFLLVHVYRADKLEKEPAPLLISLVLYGIAATFIALLLERFGSWLLGRYFPENSTPYNVLMYFGVVAFSEEGAKYFLLKRRTWNSAAFNCQFDGVVYAVFVSLGFALWENISYVLMYGLSTALVRAVTAVPGHACFGVFMGGWYGLAKRLHGQGKDGASKLCRVLALSRLQQEVAAKIVRFHVRANSDCASDQQIKLQVRDAVAEELQTILHGAETKAETEEILRENEPSIRAAALQTLRAGGSTDDITVTYGKASFEEKETGNYILPAGTYDALQINIGRAKGHNWWCMLYPSICFSDALRPVNEDGESAEKVEKSRIPLQNLLSDAAYREILKSDRISFRFFWR